MSSRIFGLYLIQQISFITKALVISNSEVILMGTLRCARRKVI